MQEKIFSFFVFLTFCGILIFSFIPTTNAEYVINEANPTIIEWKHEPKEYWNLHDRENKISLNEFLGEVPTNSTNDAYITTWIFSDYALKLLDDDGCKFIFVRDSSKTFSYLDTKLSYVKQNKNSSENILNHEQRHMDIGIIHADKVLNGFKNLENQIFDCSIIENGTNESKMKKLSNYIINDMSKPIFLQQNITNSNYDNEIKLDQYNQQQDRWDNIIDSWLDDPTMSLSDAKSLFPSVKSIYINQDKSICEFLLISDVCMISIHTQLVIQILIAIIVGGLLTAYFYYLQKKEGESIDSIIIALGESKERRETIATERMVSELSYAYSIIKRTEEDVERFNQSLIPKKGAENPPEWSDVDRMEIQFQLENFNSTMNSISDNLATIASLTSGDLDFTVTETILEITQSMKNHKISFKNNQAHLTDTRVLLQDINKIIGTLQENIPDENEE